MKKILYWFPRIGMLTFSLLVFVFALLSGAEEYGGGIEGIVLNSPNALPWLVLLVVVFIAWKWEKIGGMLLIALSVLFTVFFNAWQHVGTLFMFILPITGMGVLFLFSDKQKKN